MHASGSTAWVMPSHLCTDGRRRMLRFRGGCFGGCCVWNLPLSGATQCKDHICCMCCIYWIYTTHRDYESVGREFESLRAHHSINYTSEAAPLNTPGSIHLGSTQNVTSAPCCAYFPALVPLIHNPSHSPSKEARLPLGPYAAVRGKNLSGLAPVLFIVLA